MRPPSWRRALVTESACTGLKAPGFAAVHSAEVKSRPNCRIDRLGARPKNRRGSLVPDYGKFALNCRSHCTQVYEHEEAPGPFCT